jgi:hypothetical protein
MCKNNSCEGLIIRLRVAQPFLVGVHLRHVSLPLCSLRRVVCFFRCESGLPLGLAPISRMWQT